MRTGEQQKENTTQIRADGGWDAQIHSRCTESTFRTEVQNDCYMHMSKSHLFKANGRNRRLLKNREKRISSRVVDRPTLRGSAWEVELPPILYGAQ